MHASPTRKNMTTGKRTLGQSSKLFGQEGGSSNPAQLFKDAGPSQSPVKALGDRNAAKTPGPSRMGPSKQNASLRKGKGASGSNNESSPSKKGSSELSPRKASTSNALRSLNGKQRQTTDLPFTKPNQSSSNGEDAPATVMKTPAPSQLGNARTMSRQNSFVTPAANTGRAGQIKARMGEIMDAEMGLSLQKGDKATEQVTEPPAVQLTEEEMYPEIEYMPPSLHAKHPVFEFPDELDDLPRAKELGAQLSKFTATGFQTAGPDDLSDVEVLPMELGSDQLVAPNAAEESEDDDPWPDVVVAEKIDVKPQLHIMSKVVKAAPAAPRAAMAARPLAVGTGRTAASALSARTSTVQRANGVAGSKPSAGAGTRIVQSKTASQPVARSTGLQRSIATAPGSRALSSTAATATRTATTARPPPSAAANRAVGAGTTNRTGATQGDTAKGQLEAQPAGQPLARKKAATTLNPKLVDFVNDDLGKQTAAALDRLDADDDLESLQLDLGEAPEQDV
ncbi:hypothetical protein PHSY_002875 [Pseudozyma hubeiensis SY62]|uniref:Uncharacterized protein n=1 Tax=Pseudozyma hubeiensis (strain SY62) TaxID=1305764 RepID=R9PB61_PSEHS|nr:hypothetical protein PHSY_002875 [Pseudozyma hubeiensis SY62]GAC95300.1 hypothetical protein PHSY_002875 [Pseudozyma hubeiensis SY62]